MRRRHLVRLAVNLVNGSTLAGLAVARLGRARPARCRDGLLAGTGYRLPVPAAPAFTMGNVIITRRPVLDVDSNLFRHEARHTTQYAWCGGLLMLPLYFAAAALSWLVSGDFGAWNAFERGAGLADGGYATRPLRGWRRSRGRRRRRLTGFIPINSRSVPAGEASTPSNGTAPRGVGRCGLGRDQGPGAPGGVTAIPSR